MDAPTAEQYIAAARELHHVDGEAEIDETDASPETCISRSESQNGEIGAYVKAWVWVAREEIQPEFDPEAETEQS